MSDVALDALIVRAGLGDRRGDGVVNPFLGRRYGMAAVTTDLPLAPDTPLAAGRGPDKTLGYWLGVGGTIPGMERAREARRASHLSRYPMERIKTVDAPTTLVIENEVPRVSKRAAFFERALRGDLGDKAQRERTRFAIKHPFTFAMTGLMRSMVPLQDGQVAPAKAPDTDDPERNARAVKSLSYYLNSDLTGICEIPQFAWFSHKDDGAPIEPYHKYAIVMLIDQGFETMEGASGDDWISGSQSMRGYMRGAEIVGMMAAHIRTLGYSARAHTNIDSDVLHIPLILYAGLGEMSRIGELVLNPFVGPRFKSAVITTDMPLAVDRMIDFGLQDMCNKCLKCARECPCDAIPWGDKVMFNGYEIWKPDAERCTRYRVTNPKGAACGRCMKTCPYNHEGLLYHQFFLWLAIHVPFTRKWIADLDDKVGHGRRNPVKKWWRDLEWLREGYAVEPRAGTNQRDLDPGRVLDPAKQKIAYYHANMMPVPNVIEPQPVDRKAALAAGALLETPAAARARLKAGTPAPTHYAPTTPAERVAAKTEA
jgi:reductive dehalogenase